MVGFIVFEMKFKVWVEFLVELDDKVAAVLADGDAAVENTVCTDLIKFFEEMPGLEVEGFVPFLEFIKFFDDCDGDNNIMFFELVEAGAVM